MEQREFLESEEEETSTMGVAKVARDDNGLPMMLMDEFEIRCNEYIKASFQSIDMDFFERRGLSISAFEARFRDNFSNFIAGHFVVVPL